MTITVDQNKTSFNDIDLLTHEMGEKHILVPSPINVCSLNVNG